MRLKTISFVLIGALVPALFYIAFRASRNTGELVTQRAATEAEQTRLRVALQDAERARTESVRLYTILMASDGTQSSKPRAKSVAHGLTEPINLLAVYANHPELMNLWIATQKANLNQNYGPLFRALKLSPEQTEQLKTIMEQQIARHVDIDAATVAKGLKQEDPLVEELRRQADEQTKAEEAALLGSDEFRHLENYQRSLTVSGMVDGLAGFVAFTDPLSAIQAEQLKQVLADASPSYRAGGNAHLKEVDWSAVDEQAATILSTAQFAIWQHGNPRDIRGGSARSDIQLQNIYDRAAKADKEGSMK